MCVRVHACEGERERGREVLRLKRSKILTLVNKDFWRLTQKSLNVTKSQPIKDPSKYYSHMLMPQYYRCMQRQAATHVSIKLNLFRPRKKSLCMFLFQQPAEGVKPAVSCQWRDHFKCVQVVIFWIPQAAWKKQQWIFMPFGRTGGSSWRTGGCREEQQVSWQLRRYMVDFTGGQQGVGGDTECKASLTWSARFLLFLFISGLFKFPSIVSTRRADKGGTVIRRWR